MLKYSSILFWKSETQNLLQKTHETLCSNILHTYYVSLYIQFIFFVPYKRIHDIEFVLITYKKKKKEEKNAKDDRNGMAILKRIYWNWKGFHFIPF